MNNSMCLLQLKVLATNSAGRKTANKAAQPVLLSYDSQANSNTEHNFRSHAVTCSQLRLTLGLRHAADWMHIAAFHRAAEQHKAFGKLTWGMGSPWAKAVRAVATACWPTWAVSSTSKLYMCTSPSHPASTTCTVSTDG